MQHGTIAEVCRACAINRQQFNKYLSGAVLPKPAVLARIAAHFHVSQISLFQAKAAPQNGSALAGAGLSTALMNAITGEKPRHLREGVYFVYFPGSGRLQGLAFRSAMLFREVAGALHFTRYSITARQTSPTTVGNTPHAARHVGVAVEVDGHTYMMGHCQTGHHEVSLITLGSSSNPVDRLLYGMSLTVNRWGQPLASRVVMNYAVPLSRYREALRQVGTFPLDSDTFHKDLRIAFADLWGPQNGEPVLQSLSN